MKKIVFLFIPILFLISCEPKNNSSAQEKSPTYHIAFYSNTSGNGDIYIVDLEGRQKERLTFGDSSEYNARYNWSTKKLTYGVQQGIKTQVFQKSYASDSEEYLFDNPAFEELPAWSPDGKQIVYTKKINGRLDLFLADNSGVDLKRLTQDTFENKQAIFSPDGRQILFVSNRTGNQDIFLMGLDQEKSTPRNLTNHLAWEGHPRWSPLGDKIIFYRYENGGADLYSLSLQNDSLTNLTNSPGNELIGVFSPDGKYIAYGGIADDNWEVFVANSDGSNRRRLTFDPAFDGDPFWVPGFWNAERAVENIKIIAAKGNQ